MLTKNEVSTINSALNNFLDSAEGFPGLNFDDKLENAWETGCDHIASVSILGPVLFEKFLTISEENLREACWDNFVDYFTDIHLE